MRVFISYNQNDTGIVSHLTQELERYFHVFDFQRNRPIAGDDYVQHFMQYLVQSHCFVVCWSANYKDSEWCQYEKRAVMELKKYLPKDDIFPRIIPLMLDNTPIDNDISFHHGVPFRNPLSFVTEVRGALLQVRERMQQIPDILERERKHRASVEQFLRGNQNTALVQNKSADDDEMVFINIFKILPGCLTTMMTTTF